MIVVDSSVWIDFFHGVSTPEVERLDGLLGATPLAIGDLVLVEVMQGFRTDQDVATARQLFRSLALLPMLGGSNAWKQRRTSGSCAARGSPCARRWTGSSPRPATASQKPEGYEANLPLLFSDRDVQPYVEYLGLELA